MQGQVLRKIQLAFIHVHILQHASEAPIYATWMMEELESHGYEMKAGTMYPIFHGMEKNELLISNKQLVEGKYRKYYSITEKGLEILKEAKRSIKELAHEIK